MGARQDRYANDVNISLARLCRNGLGRLPQTGVNNFEFSFHKRVNDDFSADVVTVQTWFSDQNLDPPFTHADTPENFLMLTPDTHKRH